MNSTWPQWPHHLAWLIVALCTLCMAAAGAASQEPQRKKLIEYGWDVPYPDFVRQNIRAMEQRPFDGIMFRLKDWNHAFDTRPWKPADLAPQMADLRAISWQRFTDNFLVLYAANNWKMDWFDDAQWSTIAANLRLYARAAKAGRCVGIVFDPEPYGDNPWAYKAVAAGRSYEQVAAQVRKRGAQFMRALRQEMPDIRLLTFFHLSLFADIARLPDPAKRSEALANNEWGLQAAFYEGWLDASTDRTVMIDGNEIAYYQTRSEGFFRLYYNIRNAALALVTAPNRNRYRTRVQAGNAVYIDQLVALRQPESSTPSYRLAPADRLKWLEHNVYYALLTSEEYVWVYSERMDWWRNNVPSGVEEAIRAAAQRYRQGQPAGVEMDEIWKRAEPAR
jgi:hypothetical protein